LDRGIRYAILTGYFPMLGGFHSEPENFYVCFAFPYTPFLF